MLRPWYQSDFIWKWSKYGREAKRLIEDADELKDNVNLIAMNLQQYASCRISFSQIFHHFQDTSTEATLLQRLQRTTNKNDQLSYDEIESEVTTVMLSVI